MQEEIVTEEPETIEVDLENEEDVEPEPEKVFDLTKIQSDYESMQKEDPTKMTRMRYEKYLWLEEKLVNAGILGLQAWEAEYEIKEHDDGVGG